jgi:aminoglycoside phosphotransferase (APT) family kinase protein
LGVNDRHDIRSIARKFDIFGEFQGAEPYGTGHINDTYRATYYQGGTTIHYLHQRINRDIFKNPPQLMENVVRVTRHIRSKLNGQVGASRKSLTIVPTLQGDPLYEDGNGDFWRTYVFIEGARTYDRVQTPRQAYEAAKAFGNFQRQLVDLPEPKLHDTIPNFHHTPRRFEALQRAIEADPVDRARDAKEEIAFALEREPIVGRLVELTEKGLIPERVTHNDTKFNNVMMDDETGEAICVVDLDTVMPGLALHDFGDMVRTTTSPTLEDEQNLARVGMRFEMYESLLRGYLASAGEFLTKTEKEHLAFSGKLITFEIGIRFLTDYLLGDCYFKVHRPGHNLDRCRTQFKLVQSIERQEEAMGRLAERLDTHSPATVEMG